MIFTGWESPLALLKYELVQLDYEGVVVPSEITNKVKDLDEETHKMILKKRGLQAPVNLIRYLMQI